MMRLDGLPLPPSLLTLLDSCGFVVASDLDGLGPAELAAELGTTQEQARSLLLEVRGATRGPPKRATSSGFELLEEERRATRVVTFIERLDALLGGGVAATQLTEFSGVPGIGKTQLGMQLAVNVQIPRVMGGAEGEAVYVDTEGSFLAERCYAIATSLLAHLQRTAERDENPLHRAALQKLGAKAKAKSSTASPPTHIRKTGRRPMASARRPQKKPAKMLPRLNAEPR